MASFSWFMRFVQIWYHREKKWNSSFSDFFPFESNDARVQDESLQVRSYISKYLFVCSFSFHWILMMDESYRDRDQVCLFQSYLLDLSRDNFFFLESFNFIHIASKSTRLKRERIISITATWSIAKRTRSWTNNGVITSDRVASSTHWRWFFSDHIRSS